MLLLGREVSGATIGIVGLGRIGKEVAKRARGFNMRVLAFDPFEDAAFAREHEVTYVPLEQLLEESDFVTLHVALTPETHHLIGAAELGRMKPTAILVNASRGPVVDTDALVDALRSGAILGAALDVTDPGAAAVGSPAGQHVQLHRRPAHRLGDRADARPHGGACRAKPPRRAERRATARGCQRRRGPVVSRSGVLSLRLSPKCEDCKGYERQAPRQRPWVARVYSAWRGRSCLPVPATVEMSRGK